MSTEITEMLERRKGQDWTFGDEIGLLKAQRDALLSAAKAALDELEAVQSANRKPALTLQLRSAIALAEGKD